MEIVKAKDILQQKQYRVRCVHQAKTIHACIWSTFKSTVLTHWVKYFPGVHLKLVTLGDRTVRMKAKAERKRTFIKKLQLQLNFQLRTQVDHKYTTLYSNEIC